MATDACEAVLAGEAWGPEESIPHRIVRCLMEGLDDGSPGVQALAIMRGGRLRAVVHRRAGRTVSVVRADGGP